MKMKSAVFFIALFLIYASAYAFFSHGDINEYLSFENLEVMSPKKYDIALPRVKGILINKTNEPITVFVDLYFIDIFGQWYDKATIQKSIAQNSKTDFMVFLKKDAWKEASGSNDIKWKITYLKIGNKIVIS